MLKRINKTWVLIIFLTFLTGLLLVISYMQENSSPRQTSPVITQEVKKETALTTLIISDEVRISTISGRYEVDVNIDTGENKVTLTQLELSYDPNLLRIYSIKPAGLVTDPQILQENIDEDNGRISYWLSVGQNERWIQGSGAIATITFTKIGTGSAQLEFAPKTSVSASGVNESVLRQTIPGIIDRLTTPTPLPTRPILPTTPPEI
jgi:hypothetical protein